jgi:hypothetical protein
MRLNAPKMITWAIAAIAVIVGIVLWLIDFDNADVTYWVTAGGGILACLGAMLKGL